MRKDKHTTTVMANHLDAVSCIILPLNEEKTKADCLITVNGTDYILYIEEHELPGCVTPVIQVSWNLNSILVNTQASSSVFELEGTTAKTIIQKIARLISQTASEGVSSPIGKKEISQSARILDQIGLIGWNKLLGVNNDFSEVNLQATDNASRQHILKIKIRKDTLEFFAEFPLPFAFTWDESKTLKDIYDAFTEQIEDFQEFWEVMEELDNSCWVLEPENPSRNATYRKIAVAPNVSLKIDIDPKHPRHFPAITWLGSEATVFEFREKILDRIEMWENEMPIHSNLEQLLDLTLPTKEERKDEHDGYEVTCCICYMERLNGEVPSRTCDNQQCGQSFHSYCLYEWLRSLPQTTRRQGNKVFGTCPVCEQPISCKPPETN